MQDLALGRMLPLALTLQSRGARVPGAPGPDLRSEISQRIIGDALLRTHDLPAGWCSAPLTGRPSMLAATEFSDQLLGDVEARFRLAYSGQVIEQHIGILPRWMLRYFEEQGGDERLLSGGDGGELRVLPAGDQRFASAIISRYTDAVNVNAIFLRRHGLVMALATWQFGSKRRDALHTNDLAPVADRVWAPVADALFEPDPAHA
jgi:hypothetical protein